jgi:hypothetical protein
MEVFYKRAVIAHGATIQQDGLIQRCDLDRRLRYEKPGVMFGRSGVVKDEITVVSPTEKVFAGTQQRLGPGLGPGEDP